MVGAKQFALLRKMIGVKNPHPLSGKSNMMPPHAMALKAVSGSFLDKLDFPERKMMDRPKKSRSELLDIAFPLFVNDFTMFPNFKFGEERMEIKKPKGKEFDDDTINYLSYKVLQNIKHYLKNEEKDGKKNIEISIKI